VPQEWILVRVSLDGSLTEGAYKHSGKPAWLPCSSGRHQFAIVPAFGGDALLQAEILVGREPQIVTVRPALRTLSRTKPASLEIS
jgi:hypothetical protein